jgi:hypothetical protein
MTELPEKKDQAGDLQELSDPEFFTRWAALRSRLFCIPKSKPEHGETKRLYNDAVTEYYRRIDGVSTI